MAVAVCSVLAGVRTPVVPSGLHPVAADGHRTPPRGVGLAAVDQEQPALGVRTRPQAARDWRSAGHPTPAPPVTAPRVRRPTSIRQSNPSAPATGRSATAGDERLEGRRPRLTSHHLLQDRPDLDERRRLHLRSAAMPRSRIQRLRRRRIRQLVTNVPSTTGVVFSRSSRNASSAASATTRSIPNLQITIDRLHDRELTVANHKNN